MRPCVLKIPANLDLFTKLNEYALKYGPGSSEKYANLFREMQQNREVMNKIGGIKNLSSDQISQQKRLGLAILLAFLFFVAYDHFYMSKVWKNNYA